MRLSFCIPTFNFASFIGATLECLARQARDDVEVVVVDGASTDNTEEVVRGFAGRMPLVFHRCSENGGVDRDLAHAVSLARGEHCWLLSADDLIADGAVERVLALLSTPQDIVLFNRMMCTVDMVPVAADSFWDEDVVDRRFHLADRSDALAYFGGARSIGALFSFISSILFRRSLWPTSGPAAAVGIGTHFVAAHHLLAAARAGAALHVVSRPEVLCRGDNDSFLRAGSLRRFRIDLDGYESIAHNVFADDPVVEAGFRAVFRREHPWHRLAGPLRRAALADAAGAGSSSNELGDLQQRLARFGYPAAGLAAASLLSKSGPIVDGGRLLRRLRQRLRGRLHRADPKSAAPGRSP